MKKILIVEGNLREENQSFTDGGIKTHTESLKDSIAYFTDKIEIDVVNPSSDKNISEKVTDLDKYDGLIWGGSSLNIYNDTIEIRRQIEFMKECQKKIKKMNLDDLSKMALDDPSTSSNPKKLTINDMKVMYEHSISGKLF